MSDTKEQAQKELTASEIWENLGQWWDKDIGDGDEFHRELIFPLMKQLVQLKTGDTLLDIGCGNGALIRHLHRKGVTFIGVDYSKTFIEAAKKRSEDFSSVIYQQCDATSLDALKQLSTVNQTPVKYDVVMSSMVMHDLSTIEPLYEVLPNLVKENGQFIFSIPSPHYNSIYSSIITHKNRTGVFTTDYNTVAMKMEKAKSRQPYDQCNFHRPLGSYINPLARKGFVLTELKEPVATTQKLIESTDYWKMASNIPLVTICSFKYQPQQK